MTPIVFFELPLLHASTDGLYKEWMKLILRLIGHDEHITY